MQQYSITIKFQDKIIKKNLGYGDSLREFLMETFEECRYSLSRFFVEYSRKASSYEASIMYDALNMLGQDILNSKVYYYSTGAGVKLENYLIELLADEIDFMIKDGYWQCETDNYEIEVRCII